MKAQHRDASTTMFHSQDSNLRVMSSAEILLKIWIQSLIRTMWLVYGFLTNSGFLEEQEEEGEEEEEAFYLSHLHYSTVKFVTAPPGAGTGLRIWLKGPTTAAWR